MCLTSTSASATRIVVDRDAPLQTIEGFGAFGAQKVWWDGPPYFDEKFVDLIVDDLGSSIVRTQIYWDGEAANDDDDPAHFEWKNFDFGPTSNNGKQFEYLKALAARDVRIIASVWSPPIWMKQGVQDELEPRFCRGQCGGTLQAKMREEFAEYLLAYTVRLEEATGLRLWALSVQNEPLFANRFESCVYDAAAYAATLRTVAARFAHAGKATKFIGPEHMGSFAMNVDSGLFAATLDEPDVSRWLHAYAVHGYLDGMDPDYGSAEGWSSFAAKVEGAGKKLWMTETSSDGDDKWSTAWDMVRSLHLALKFGRVSAWTYWAYPGRLTAEQERLPLFHLFKPWYRFVRPGFVQIESRANDANLLVTAFQRGAQELVVIVINNGSLPLQVQLEIDGGPVPTRWETSRTAESTGFVGLSPETSVLPIFEPRSITTLVAVRDSSTKTPAAATPISRPPRQGPSDGRCGCRWAPERVSWVDGSSLAAALTLIGRRRARKQGRTQQSSDSSPLTARFRKDVPG